MISAYSRAKIEGRICPQCQWIINKVDFQKGYRICRNCTDVNKGVNVRCGHYPYQDEPRDKTGDMP